MNRRTLWCCVLVGSLAAAVAGAIGGCGSDTTPDDNSDAGDDSGNTSGSSSGFSSSGTSGTSGTSGSTGGPNNCTPPMSIAVAPADKTANVAPGVAFTQAYTATATYAGGMTKDVTADSFFSVSDPGVGSFTGSTFTWGGTQGGAVLVSAKTCGVVGSTHLFLKASVTFGAGGGVDAGADGGGGSDAGLTGTFNSAPPTGTTACNPTLLYPNEGTLIPPNTNVMEIHFTDGTPPNNLFEISFENSVTDVKVYTTCSGTSPDQGQQSSTIPNATPGGCIFTVSQAEWDYIAKTNRDGDPVTVQVKGLGCDASGGVGISNVKHISFAKDDMRGTLYYWASMRIAGAGSTVFSGGVYRYDFGVRGQAAEAVLTPTTTGPGQNPTGLCIGCHDISRDGRQMVFDFDDNDADDEYGDVNTDVYDIAAKKAAIGIVKNAPNSFPPGYHTWNRTTTEFLLSDGPGNTGDAGAGDAGAFRRVTPDGGTLGFTKPANVRGTTPDWAPDDSRVVFAVPPDQFNPNANAPGCGYWMKQQGPRDDLMFMCSALYTAPWDNTTKKLGAAALLLAQTGNESFYYPSFSPEGSLIVYNHASNGSQFHNPLARVEVLSASAATPTRDYLTALNGVVNGDTSAQTNSWARWAPFVQTYKGKQLLWVTFSSTRNYGLRIDNTVSQNCVPKESPKYAGTDFSTEPTSPPCSRTQLWMAAITLDAASVQAGTDVSFPAFYLPFQDITTNNHLAQWAQKSFTGTCNVDADCSAQPGKCCDMGGCTTCASTTPPPATCAADINCATGMCCNSGTCGACGGADGGGDASGGPSGCSTCLDCGGQACNMGQCGSCTNSSQCCAPLICNAAGHCVNQVN